MIRALFKDILHKWKFSKEADRIGPDMPFTHWKLYFPSSMKNLCKKRFRRFCETSEFRPGAYAVHCSQISIGYEVVIRPSTMLFADEYAEIIINDNVMIGSGVHFYVNNHRFTQSDIPIIQQGYTPSQSVIIEEGAWIGANSIILPGVKIGKNSVIGAGSVVTRSVPDFEVYAGTPAKRIKSIID